MANKIKLKQSSVSGKVPTTTDLDLGELGINTYDGKLFLKQKVGAVETIIDVTGAASGVTSVSGSAPIVSSGGVTPSISISAATTLAAGSMSAADKTKIDAVTGTNTGDETASTIKTKLGITTLSGSNTGDQVIPVASSTAPAALGTAAVGTGTTFARADHVHTLPSLATLGAQAAGSYVTVGGALGTPSSGTVTNLTGTASININGTVGATTPTTGSFSLAKVGIGSGAVSLSINDGYGNANVCFNHYAGTPDNTSVGAGLGSSARITASVDSSTGSLQFQVGNATSSGVAVSLTAIETMTTTGTTSYVNFTAPVLISNVATGTAPFVVTSTTPVANLNIGGTASNITAYTVNQNVGTANTVQHSDITTARAAAPTTGYVYYGNTGTKYAGFDGTNFVSSMPMSFNILGSSASCTGNAATASNVLGNGQTWQSVIASRAKNTTYTNSTGRSIFVVISGQASAAVPITVGGYTIGTTNTANTICTFGFVVPAGGNYSWSSASGTIGYWTELR
jgi:hypothetical protein